ncbi:hypothetical protein [Xanthomonas axonopodis]|nr:hypothetical protein [Xanthomonas axonopodis]
MSAPACKMPGARPAVAGQVLLQDYTGADVHMVRDCTGFDARY